MKDHPTDEILDNLLQRPPRSLQFSLRTLTIVSGVAPVVLWLSYLALPYAPAALTAFIVPSGLPEIDLLSDSIGAIAVSFVAAGSLAFCFMLLSEGNKIAAVTTIGGAIAMGFVAVIICCFGGAGDTSAANAKAGDLFVVFGIPLSIAIAFGAFAGAAVYETY